MRLPEYRLLKWLPREGPQLRIPSRGRQLSLVSYSGAKEPDQSELGT